MLCSISTVSIELSFISSVCRLMMPVLRITRLLVTPCSMERKRKYSYSAISQVSPKVISPNTSQQYMGTLANQCSWKTLWMVSPLDSDSSM